MTKTQYDKIYVLFKGQSKDIYDWVLLKAQEGDLSRSSFILQCLKKIKKLEDKNNAKEIDHSGG